MYGWMKRREEKEWRGIRRWEIFSFLFFFSFFFFFLKRKSFPSALESHTSGPTTSKRLFSFHPDLTATTRNEMTTKKKEPSEGRKEGKISAKSSFFFFFFYFRTLFVISFPFLSLSLSPLNWVQYKYFLFRKCGSGKSIIKVL